MGGQLSAEETMLRLPAEMNITQNISQNQVTALLNSIIFNRRFTPNSEAIVTAIYVFLIVIGFMLNVLVGYVVVFRRKMNTPRNLYLLNLTACDLSLCTICTPFSLIKLLSSQWTLGSFLCKLVGGIQCINVMMAVGTITVIALDRYFAICYRPREHTISTRRRIIVSLIFIWIISLVASIPVFLYTGLLPVELSPKLILYHTCAENWPQGNYRIIYDISILLIIAVIPPSVVGTVYALIALHLRKNICWQKNSSRTAKEIQRNRRMTCLLSGIVIILAVSWLPLNIYHVLLDLGYTSSSQRVYINLAITDLLAMSTAVTNPILYGWLNSNIRSEILVMFPSISRFYCNCCIHSAMNVSKDIGLSENETVTTLVQHYAVNVNKNKESVALIRTECAQDDCLTTL